VISLGPLGFEKENSPLEMARMPLHEPRRAMILLLRRVKGWLSGMGVVRLGKWSW